MRRREIGLVIALSLCLTFNNGQAADEQCYASWSEAAPIVRAQGLVDMEQLSALATPNHVGGEIVKSTLCRDQGRFIYRLVIREAKGRLKMVAVDARKPFGQ